MNDRDDFDFPRGRLNEGEPKFLKLADALWNVMCEHAPDMPMADVAKCVEYIRGELDNVSVPPGEAPLGRMTEQQFDSLRTVVRFFWRDEQRHFEDMKANGDALAGHIFLHLNCLDHYLNHEPTGDVINL